MHHVERGLGLIRRSGDVGLHDTAVIENQPISATWEAACARISGGGKSFPNQNASTEDVSVKKVIRGNY